MDGGKAAQPGIAEALHSTLPQVDVRVDRVFHHNAHVSPALRYRVCYLLDCEWVGSRACAYPQYVYAGIYGSEDMPSRPDLRGHGKPRLALGTHQPRQGLLSCTLETPGLCARLPYPGAEYVCAGGGKGNSGLHDLRFALCAARPCNDDR